MYTSQQLSQQSQQSSQAKEANIKIYIGDQSVPDFTFLLQPGASLSFSFGQEFLEKMNLVNTKDIQDPLPKQGKYYIKVTNKEEKKQYLSLSLTGELGQTTYRTEKSSYLYVGPQKTTL
eukprot:TRINITY_DN38130_c0_g1_i1.p3 TRINITY_DN38130_c0_g1~~TRINITY_DN38130_c0_g1_i1.p3  ORF type:complete len:119 (-),score=20.02 TRINITY_DN38130_c0_g1_i1:179-535(-)